jgi:LEA14-like dessication related protein
MKRLAYLFVILAFVIAGCSSPKPLVYQDVSSVQLQKFDIQHAAIVANLRFYNPNNYGLSLKNGNLDAYVNDKYLGKASVDERIAVPPSNSFILPVTINIDMLHVLKDAFDLLSLQKNDVLLRLQGVISAGKGGVYFRVPVTYEGRQKIQI